MDDGVFIRAVRTSRAPRAASGSLWQHGRPRCLVVDDDPIALDVARVRLESHDVEVVTASSGRDGLAAIAEAIPDCVLLDLMMPDMTGYDVCAEIKRRWPEERIPIIICTALVGKRERIRAFEAGADNFLQKPLVQVELSACLRAALATRELHLRLSQKMQQVAELERSRASAFEELTGFLRFADRSIRELDPLAVDPTFDALVAQLVRRSPSEVSKPSHVFMASRTVQGTFEGFVWSWDGGRPQRHPGPVTLQARKARLLFPGAGGTTFANREDTDLDAAFDAALGRIVGAVHNYAACSSGRVGVVGFNYLTDAGDFAAHLLQAFVMHSNVLEALADQARETEASFIYAIGALARASEANDEDTGNHILRVNEYSRVLAEDLGCPPELVRQIHYSAQMHDVGKIHIRREILRKNGPLTPEEWAEMKEHTLHGVKILGDSPRLEVARQIAASHHERFDGTGYPYGVRGEAIPLPARLVSVADVYDALRSKRSYKPEFSHERSIEILLSGDGRVEPRHFDPAVLDAFRRRTGEFQAIFESLRDEPPPI